MVGRSVGRGVGVQAGVPGTPHTGAACAEAIEARQVITMRTSRKRGNDWIRTIHILHADAVVCTDHIAHCVNRASIQAHQSAPVVIERMIEIQFSVVPFKVRNGSGVYLSYFHCLGQPAERRRNRTQSPDQCAARGLCECSIECRLMSTQSWRESGRARRRRQRSEWPAKSSRPGSGRQARRRRTSTRCQPVLTRRRGSAASSTPSS